MRPYDISGPLGAAGSRERIWSHRSDDYNEHKANMTPWAVNLRITAARKNKGMMTFGGRKVVGAQSLSWQGFPDLAPGQAFCWDFENRTVDVRAFWYDGTIATDVIVFAWLGEPLPERLVE